MSLGIALLVVCFWLGSALYAADWNICSHVSSSDAAGTLSNFWTTYFGFAAGWSSSGVTQPTISGRVFEDVQYGGGSGRSFAEASGGVGRAGATVELYNSSGAFLSSLNTDANGQYTFTGLSAASYSVRVVNSTVTSSRSGANGSEVAVQTFRADGDGEPAGTGTNKVGGEQPQSTDAPANNGWQTLTDLQSPVGQYTQSIVSLDTSGGSLGGIDFGFNFDTIVNTNNSGQGSLRQFIFNANLLANSGLDQDDCGVAKSPGVEHTIFMIPLTDSGYGTDPSGGDGNAFTIQLDSIVLADITDADTAIDGRTQTAFTGNTNNSVANTSTGPEVVVDFGNENYDLCFFSVRGYLYDVGIYRAGAPQAVCFQDVATPGSAIQNATICQGANNGLQINNSDGITIADNVFRGNGTASTCSDGILISSGSANTITGNAFVTNGNSGIEFWSGVSDGNIISQNYCTNQDVCVYLNVGTQNTISRNTITNHSVAGIIIGTNATGNTITRNVIYANAGLGIELSADGSWAGDGVTANDANDGDSGANDLLNYPVITAAIEIEGTLSIDFDLDVPAGDYRIEFFKNPSGVDPSGYGEGESFAGAINISHPGGGTQSFSHSFSGVVGDIITATTTIDLGGGSYRSTSEFSAIYTATGPPPHIDLTRDAAVISDPFNNSVNPKIIPGAVLSYTVTVTNQGGAADADTVIITNPVGDQNMLFVGDLAGCGSGPVSFSDGSTASGLTCTFSSLDSVTDSISFSNDDGSTYTYTPTPDADGYDAGVTHVRVSPAGTFAVSDGSNHPSFRLAYRAKVQ